MDSTHAIWQSLPMNTDPTESARRALTEELNMKAAERARLEQEHGQVWDTQQLAKDFEVRGFMAPFVVVRRKTDNQIGSLMFQHDPRYYFGFAAD